MKFPFDRGGLRFYLVLLALGAGYSSDLSILCGTPLILLGVALHIWSKGCLTINSTVTTIGPYRYVRHPFYAANALIDTGIAVMSGWWLLIAALPVWWLSVYLPVIRREERFLASRFPAEYEAYKKSVSALLPLRRPLPKRGREFSWHHHHIAHGRELSRALRILCYPLLFFAWNEIRTEGLRFLTDNYCLEFWALTILLALYVLAWELEQHTRHRRRILPIGMSTGLFRAGVSLAILAAAGTLTYLETELDAALGVAGVLLVGLSILAHLRRSEMRLVAEAFALLGAVALSEVLWLSAIVIAYYGALLLDSRLIRQTEEPVQRGWPRALEAGWSAPYPALLSLVVLVSAAKEIFID